MLKTMRFMLVALLTMVCGSMFGGEVTWSASSGDNLRQTIAADANITLTWSDGSHEQYPSYSNGSVRFRNGQRLTVAGISTEVTITQIEFTFTGDYNSLTVRSGGGSYSAGTWTGESNKVEFQSPGERYISAVKVTYEGESTAEKAPVLSISNNTLADSYDMDQSTVFVVYAKNEGNEAAQNARLAVLVDGAENAAWTIGTLAIGEEKWQNMKFNYDGLEAGQHQVTLSLTADNADAVTVEKAVTFTKKAPEATFSINAGAVTVPYDEESFDVVATLSNTSEVDASNVQVELRDGITTVVASNMVTTIAAGEEALVLLTVEGGPFPAGTKNYYLYVNDKYLAAVEVTVEEAPIVPVYDLAITSITGTLKLENATNNVQIVVENKGNQDIADAAVTLKAGETVLGTSTVTAAAGQQGWCTIAVASEGLEAGELAVTATVEVENDATPEDNTKDATLTVEAAPVPQATFALSADPVEVMTTDAKIAFRLKVENTSDIDAAAEDFVKVIQGATVLAQESIYPLSAGMTKYLDFELDNTYTHGGTYDDIQVWVNETGTNGNTRVSVTVTEPVVTMAITDINGTIDLTLDANYLTVAVENQGTADVADAKVVLTVAGEEAELGEATVSMKAGKSGIVSVLVNTEGLEAGTLPVHAAIVAGEETLAEFDKDVTVTDAAPAEATFTVSAENVEVPFGAESFDIVATVKNTSEVDAADVEVKLMKGAEVLETKTVEALAAGAEETVTFTRTEMLEAGKTATYYVQVANQAQAEVEVTFAAEAVEETVDLAIAQVSCSAIDLTLDANYATVAVENKGTVVAENVQVVLTVDGEDAPLGTGTIDKIAVGQTRIVSIEINTEGLEAGTLPIRAEVMAEGDVNPADNVMVKDVEVTNGAAVEPTFSMTAENIEVKAGEAATCVIKVTNTSTADATGVEVKVLYSIQTVATKTVDIAAGETVDVEFSVTAEQLNQILAMLGGRTSVELHAMAGNAECFFTVTVVEEVEPVIDMVIEAIQGVSEINLAEENKVQVWYRNNSNVDLEGVVIMLSVNDHSQEQAVDVKAGKNGYVEFTIPTDIFEPAEDTEAELIAWVNVEGDTNADNNRVTRTVSVVSGEVAPAAEIAINSISGWEVEAGEQTVNVTVTLFNNGEVDANDVTVELYKSYGDGLCEPQTVSVPAGEQNWKVLTFTFDYTFEAGKDYQFTVFTNYSDENPDNQMQQFTLTCPAAVADVAVAKIAPVEATTEDNIVIAATLKNQSELAATDVKVGIYQIVDLQYQLVGIQQTVETIEAGAEVQVEFSLGQLEAGNYTYYVRVVTEDGNMDNNIQDVTVKVTEAEAETIDMAIQAIQGPAEINLKGENVYKVWYQNEGNVTVEGAEIILLVNDNEAGRQAVTAEPGKNGFVEFTLDVDNLFDPTEDLGLEATLIGFVNVDGDANAENNRSQMTATVVSKEDVAEPVFTIAAEPVVVEFAAESFNVVATITSDIDAADVEVQLFYNQTVATQTVSFTAGEPVEVTFSSVANPFPKAGEYTMYIIAGKATGEVAVTVKDAPVEEVKDMAITAIQGLSQIDLTKENKVTVWYENKGTVDLENVVINFSVNDNGQQQTVNVAAGKSGYVEFTIDVADFEPAEDTEAELIAWVNVEGDADNSNDRVTRTVPVVNGEVAQPTFSVTAENVVVPFGAESFDIFATVTNTSEVDATGVLVNLLDGINNIAGMMITEIPAGDEGLAFFTVEATEENPFPFGQTKTYYVQVANQAQAEVEVTFEAEPVAEVADLSVYAISGTISLENDVNTLTVWVNNNGTVDVENAKVVLTVDGEEAELGVGTVSVKAGQEMVQCAVQLIMDGLEAGILPVRAEVILPEGMEDAKPEDNVYVQNFTVAAPQPVLSFTVADVEAVVNAASFDVKVTVANTGKGAAENVAVKIYDENSALLAETTIASIAAGAEEVATVTIENTYTEVGTFKNQLQVYVAGVEGVKWVSVTVTTTTAIEVIKAVYGENVQIFTLSGKKVSNVQKGNVYIINGQKTLVK